MSQFKKEDFAQMAKILCPMNLDKNAAVDFAEQVKVWLPTEAIAFVLDLNGVNQLSRDFYKAVIDLKNSLKNDEKGLHSINVNPTISRQLKQDGMEKVFSPMEPEAPVKPKTQAAAVEVGVINPFLSATMSTLEVQCKTKVVPQKPYMKKEQLPNIAIAGVISLISKGFAGSIVLCFEESTFLKIYERMLGEVAEKVTLETQDAAGELLNIIYGTAKTELNQKGYNFDRALPTVLTGEKLSIRQTGSLPVMIVPFQSDIGIFHIEIEFSATTTQPASV
jgi:chemotaxis protein CheX